MRDVLYGSILLILFGEGEYPNEEMHHQQEYVLAVFSNPQKKLLIGLKDEGPPNTSWERI